MASSIDLARLRTYLNLALTSLGMSPRKIEDGLGIGHGTLNRLLDGRMDLKLNHLLILCRVLDIHPRDLIEAGFPDWEATHRLNDWLPVKVRKASPPPALSAEVLEAIRTTVREELSRAGLAPGVKPAKKR